MLTLTVIGLMSKTFTDRKTFLKYLGGFALLGFMWAPKRIFAAKAGGPQLNEALPMQARKAPHSIARASASPIDRERVAQTDAKS